MNPETPESLNPQQIAEIESQLDANATRLLKPKAQLMSPAVETLIDQNAVEESSAEIAPQVLAASEPATAEFVPQVLAPLELRFVPAPVSGESFQSSLTLDVQCVSPTAEIRYALGAPDGGRTWNVV